MLVELAERCRNPLVIQLLVIGAVALLLGDVRSAVVPGDIVVLRAGSLIPADLRLISAKDFFVSQSSLPGESLPVAKHADPASATGCGVIELPNSCVQGNNVWNFLFADAGNRVIPGHQSTVTPA